MNSLSEMLDAIELGVLHLRRERDELRETLARTKPQAEVKTAKPVPAKAPSKARPALGRTLSQIRKSAGPV